MKTRTDKVFNTAFETSLRLLILLDVSGEDMDVENIQAADFMATYGKEFSIANNSANGDNPYMFCELAVRKSLIESALKLLVARRLVLPTATDSGFLYRPLFAGHQLAQSMDTKYSKEYRDAAEKALGMIESQGVQSVLKAIKKKSRLNLGRRLSNE